MTECTPIFHTTEPLRVREEYEVVWLDPRATRANPWVTVWPRVGAVYQEGSCPKEGVHSTRGFDSFFWSEILLSVTENPNHGIRGSKTYMCLNTQSTWKGTICICLFIVPLREHLAHHFTWFLCKSVFPPWTPQGQGLCPCNPQILQSLSQCQYFTRDWDFGLLKRIAEHKNF